MFAFGEGLFADVEDGAGEFGDGLEVGVGVAGDLEEAHFEEALAGVEEGLVVSAGGFEEAFAFELEGEAVAAPLLFLVSLAKAV